MRAGDLHGELKKKYSVLSNPQVSEELTKRIEQGVLDLATHLGKANPFKEFRRSLSHEKLMVAGGDVSLHRFEKACGGYFLLLDYLKALTSEKKFWSGEMRRFAEKTKKSNDNHTAEIKTSLLLLFDQWEKMLDKGYADWELRERDAYRKTLLEKLEEWLALLQELREILKVFDGTTGLWLDLSEGGLKSGDLEQLRKWTQYLRENKSVNELCDLLGKIRIAEEILEKEKTEQTLIIHNIIPDSSSKEEISGLCCGNSLANVVPHEFSLLQTPETEMLFYKRFAEAQLLSFDMMGYAMESQQIKVEVEIDVSAKEKLGPMILCVDTSGSMHGVPENIAKAVALTMAVRAREQQRDCEIVSFSTQICSFDLSKNLSMEDLMEFLKMSFHGGTDVAPALQYSLDKMKKGKFENSDVLVVSDFIMDSVPNALYKSIEKQKEKGNRFFSLNIGNLFLSERQGLFDRQWVFNPKTMTVTEMMRMLRNAQFNGQTVQARSA